jgi:hypothetical protein
MRILSILVVTIALVGCATQAKLDQQTSATVSDPAKISYYDRNHDGRVDYEFHDYGCCDRNWALVDTDFNGRYDLEVLWGDSYQKKPTDLPVAVDVTITPGQPESYR